ISLFEIAIKNRLGKLPLPLPFAAIFPALLLASDIHLLPLEPDHIEPLTRLPLHHKDPFDRLIAATALVEGLILVSADAVFDSYALTRRW
ncbi:MAG TPA: type II toxin-antitoxin system VapC family toxin, partial [Gemmataceae bacterium]|nr:type II toxin-antitoxin system VapC family toxin [Gemmataceae bacterium]